VEATREIEQAIRNFDLALSLARPPAPAPVEVAQRPVAPPPQPEPVLHAAAPGMVLASPAVTDGKQTVEVDASPLVIRGAVMDSSGIPVVTVNGLPANIRPLNNQAVEFWSDPLPLHPGANPILLSAANSSHAETRMILTINYIPKATLVNPRALDKEALISLLAGSVPPSRVAQIVKERGLKFTPTSDDLNEIRAAGGNEELIQAIQKATVPPK
jgi:hypothetical protein